MAFDDLRGFMKRADELGLLKTVEGADWSLEIGGITELGLDAPDMPMLVFDKIKDYPAGYRVVTNFLNIPKLVALAFDLPLEDRGIDQVRGFRDLIQREFSPVRPVEVKTGPVMENVHVGDDVDIFEFPTPKWHERDGGRYIGTGSMVIQRDPDTGVVNVGTYRSQIHDKNVATVYMSPGKHGDVIRRKYWAKGQSCPVAVVMGGDPLLWSTAHSAIPLGVDEFEYAGWLRGKPIEVIKGEITGLPIPAAAEIVFEGELLPPGTETVEEGPFGEWTGYYASGSRHEPIFKVKSVMHRNDPIILGAPPQFGTYDYWFGKNAIRAAIIWNELDKNVPGVKGVWVPTEARGPLMVIVSLEQKYAGHAKQAANFVSGYYQSAFVCRWVIVVDDDIDPSNHADVYWALATRCDPDSSIDILRGCWSSLLDPILPPDKRERRELTNSMGVVVACKPFYWKDQFPRSVRGSAELRNAIKEKWGKKVFDGAF
ncbi:MAG: UbiD family decarboxylase [Chloroflexi bacterium]|nr:UbiD family decarboxylase [Chloroflexota bacterium]